MRRRKYRRFKYLSVRARRRRFKRIYRMAKAMVFTQVKSRIKSFSILNRRFVKRLFFGRFYSKKKNLFNKRARNFKKIGKKKKKFITSLSKLKYGLKSLSGTSSNSSVFLLFSRISSISNNLINSTRSYDVILKKFLFNRLFLKNSSFDFFELQRRSVFLKSNTYLGRIFRHKYGITRLRNFVSLVKQKRLVGKNLLKKYIGVLNKFSLFCNFFTTNPDIRSNNQMNESNCYSLTNNLNYSKLLPNLFRCLKFKTMYASNYFTNKFCDFFFFYKIFMHFSLKINKRYIKIEQVIPANLSELNFFFLDLFKEFRKILFNLVFKFVYTIWLTSYGLNYKNMLLKNKFKFT